MKTLVIVLQSFCIGLTLSGIYVEWLYEANLGFLLITLGSLTFAISTKLRKTILERTIKKLLNEKDK